MPTLAPSRPVPPNWWLPPLPPMPSLAALKRRPTTERTTSALFLLAAVRDGLMAFFVVVEGPFFMSWLLIPTPHTWVLALFPLTGLIASAWCAHAASSAEGRESIPLVGLAAVVFSAFPGILAPIGGLGPFGLLFAAGGLLSHRAFRRRELEGAHPAAA